LLAKIKGRWACLPLAALYQEQAKKYEINLYGRIRKVTAFVQVIMLKTLKCSVRVVWVYRKTRWVALFSTDQSLSVAEIIEYYGARWKIESGFKELNQDIGSLESQCRAPHAVVNHLNFCMMAATIIWIYAMQLENVPKRRHAVKGRNHFAFSGVRREMTETLLGNNFSGICTSEGKAG